MNKQFAKDAIGWGAALWLIGYALGLILFAIAPVDLIGWIIMPIGAALSIWVAFRKVKGDSFQYYSAVAVVWLLVAMIGDYLFIVQALKPAHGYYKTDVYLYYTLTFTIPLLAGWRKTRGRTAPA